MKRFIATLLLLGCFFPLVASAQFGQYQPVLINAGNVGGFRGASYVEDNIGIEYIDEGGGTVQVVLCFAVPAQEIDARIAQQLQASGCKWLTYLGTVITGYHTFSYMALKFRLAPNTSSSTRMVVIGCTSPERDALTGVGIIQPGRAGGLEAFSLSSATTTALYPGYRYSISLSGSEQGVEYVLMRSNEDVARLEGTGGQLVFTGDWGAGTFTVVAHKNGNTRNMKNTLQIPWSLLVEDKVGRIGGSDGAAVVLPPDGGQGEIMIMFEHVENNGQVAIEASAMVESWMTGGNEKWNSDFLLTNRRGGPNYILLTVKANPNTTGNIKSGILSVGFDSEGVSRNLYVTQQPTYTLPPLVRYALSIVNYDEQTPAGDPVDLRLSGSQTGVLYKLYSNGLEIRSMEGTGEPIVFWDVTHSGPFMAKAFRDDETLVMNTAYGSTTQKNSRTVVERIYNLTTGGSKYNTMKLDGLGRMVRESFEDYVYFEDMEEALGYDYDGLVELFVDSSEAYRLWEEWESREPLIQHWNSRETEYDAAGRPHRARQDNYIYRERDEDEESWFLPGFYGEPVGYDRREYSEVEYDNTPKNRVIRKTPDGLMHDSYTDGKADYTYEYGKNTASDAIKRFILNGDGLALSGTYPAGTLQKTVVSAPHGQAAAEFRNHDGVLVASREAADHFTHYVYDDMGRLRYVVPPLMDSLFTSGSRTFNQLSPLCYWYEYDEEGRVYRKNIPGAGITKYLYNKRGQLVLSQDARMATQSKWVFTKYDAHGRVVQTGTCVGTEQAHRQQLAAQQIFHETAEYTADEESGQVQGYSCLAYPTNISESNLLTVYFYDNYEWGSLGCHPFRTAEALGNGHIWSTRGMQTGQKERVLGVDDGDREWLVTTYYYDDEGRMRQKISDMSIIGQEVESFMYNENGDVVQQRVRQQRPTESPFMSLGYDRFYMYNPVGGLHRIEQEIDGDDENGRVPIATYWYDHRGDLSQKWLHGLWDTVRYERAIDRTLVGVKSSTFNYQLSRDDAASPYARYDGNVGVVSWESGVYGWGENGVHFYTYDQLGRLKTFATDWYKDASYGYDRNGNITSMCRRWSINYEHAKNDNIRSDYGVAGNGNALRSITRNGVEYSGYTYDSNGNMIHDAARDIDIHYNILNLPSQVGNVSYTYTSIGRKLMMSVNGSKTYYQGDVVYEGNSLRSLYNPEGETRFTISHPLAVGFDAEYRYFYKDHLGSVRAVSAPSDCWPWSAQMLFNDYENDRWGENRDYFNIDYQAVDYFPFGTAFWDDNFDRNKVLFTGKEIQDARVGGDLLRLYDFGARHYDPTVGRWTAIDPMAEMYYSRSPYNYVRNNPIRYIDPNGMYDIETIIVTTTPVKNSWRKWGWDGNTSSLAGFSRYAYSSSNSNGGLNIASLNSAGVTVPLYQLERGIPTYAFGNEEYYGGSHRHGNLTYTAFDFGEMWVSGYGGNYTLGEGDTFADQLLTHSSVSMAYDNIAQKINEDKLSGHYYHSVAGVSNLNVLATDIRTIISGFLGGSYGNPAATYFGSYNINWSVTSLNTEARTANVRFQASNTMSIGSALRPPLIGHTKEWQTRVEPSLRGAADRFFPPQTINVVWNRTLNY
ncbi:RHS repeat-associated core domain-containing protein [Alistipes sp. OttesenSCG-928-B03]|nr:RHS repeat-associated core domain-containing protein [Alistipes sp. OttesenSCG-928-B03]